MKTISFFFVLLITWILFSSSGQNTRDQKPISINTSDVLYWNGKKYYMSSSPITALKGFDTIYSHLPAPPDEIFGDRIGTIQSQSEKNYTVIWKIVNDSLYISKLYFPTMLNQIKDIKKYFKPEDNKGYSVIEKFTGIRFNRANKAVTVKPLSPQGVIPATWYSDTLRVKIFPDWDGVDSNIRYEDWEKMPEAVLIFRSGKLIGFKQIPTKKF